MKIKKSDLKKIIAEEKAKLVLEMNPDGTISDDEDNERAIMMRDVEDKMEDLVRFIQAEAQRIGGGFRSPGIKRQALKLAADLLHSAR